MEQSIIKNQYIIIDHECKQVIIRDFIGFTEDWNEIMQEVPAEVLEQAQALRDAGYCMSYSSGDI